jgi:hypothetical protein
MINDGYEKIKINKDYIMIDLNYQMEIVMEDCNPYDIGIQNGILHIDHSAYNVRFESEFLPYDEITSIIIEPRQADLSAEDIMHKIRGTDVPFEDMSLVNQLKNHKKVDIT